MKLGEAIEKYEAVINKDTYKIVKRDENGNFSFSGNSKEWNGPWVEYKGEWQRNPINHATVLIPNSHIFNKLYCGANIELIWAVMEKLSEGYVVICEHGYFGVMEYWMNLQKNNIFCIGECKYFSSGKTFQHPTKKGEWITECKDSIDMFYRLLLNGNGNWYYRPLTYNDVGHGCGLII